MSGINWARVREADETNKAERKAHRKRVRELEVWGWVIAAERCLKDEGGYCRLWTARRPDDSRYRPRHKADTFAELYEAVKADPRNSRYEGLGAALR